MFRLAHVSDPHFQGFRNVKLRELFSKRALGGMNLLLRRRRKHNMALLQALLEDLPRRSIDHLALTGDLCNIALESEWAAASRWIEATSLPAEQVTVIPGNHDAYVSDVVRAGTFERVFGAYQSAELRVDAAVYPFVRLRGEVALIGVSTAVPTGDFGAWGRIGQDQLARLTALLHTPEVRTRRRVLLIHHPPLVNRPGEDRNLTDRGELQALLERDGVDLVLHGHDHRDYFNELPGPKGTRIPVVGVGSASYDSSPDRRCRYHVIDIDAAHITTTTYAHDATTGTFVEHGRKAL